MGMLPSVAKVFAEDMFIGFPLKCAEIYAESKFREGAAKQKEICSNTNLITKYDGVGLELIKAVKMEILNAPEPEY